MDMGMQLDPSKLSLSAWQQIPSLGLQMAVVVVSVIPILLVYPFLQKYFVKGMLTGAIKG
jgi:ABC-type glycerol-3-phosphate transport system permease component